MIIYELAGGKWTSRIGDLASHGSMERFQPKAFHRYALVMPTGELLARCIIACWEANAVAIPIDPRLPRVTIAAMIEHSDPHEVVDSLATVTREVKLGLSPEGDFAIIYTSGSTSAPKGVVLTRKAVALDARRVADWHEWRNGVSTGTVMGLHHVNAFSGSLMGGYLTGTNLFLVTTNDPTRILDACRTAGLQTLHVAPYHVRRILDEGVRMPDTLKYVLSASAPLTKADCLAWEKLNGPCRITQGYGLSETVNMPFILPRPDKLTPGQWRELHCEANPPLGEAAPYCDWLFDYSLMELRLGGEMLCRYWQDEKATAESRDETGKLKTGDLVRGVVIGGSPMPVFVSRSKETMNHKGLTVYPAEAEEMVRDFLRTEQELVCFGAANDVEQDALGIAVDGIMPRAEVELLTSRSFMPLSYYVESIPRTSTGKPMRGLLSKVAITDCCSEGEANQYVRLMQNYAVLNAERFQERNAMSQYMRQEIAKILLLPTPTGRREGRSVIDDVLDAYICAANDVEKFGAGVVFKAYPELWYRLMNESPMNAYPRLANSFLIRRLPPGAKVLEVGSGTGNLTSYIAGTFEVTATDLRLGLLPTNLPVKEACEWNFDESLPLEFVEQFDAVVAVNAIHCAKRPELTLFEMGRACKPTGFVLLAEGSPMMDARTPWWGNLLFGSLNGWYNRGGFRSRANWLTMIDGINGVRAGFSTLRAGRYDLGGLIWMEGGR